jgi:hypothetical protein
VHRLVERLAVLRGAVIFDEERRDSSRLAISSGGRSPSSIIVVSTMR